MQRYRRQSIKVREPNYTTVILRQWSSCWWGVLAAKKRLSNARRDHENAAYPRTSQENISVTVRRRSCRGRVAVLACRCSDMFAGRSYSELVRFLASSSARPVREILAPRTRPAVALLNPRRASTGDDAVTGVTTAPKGWAARTVAEVLPFARLRRFKLLVCGRDIEPLRSCAGVLGVPGFKCVLLRRRRFSLGKVLRGGGMARGGSVRE
jgi:hypothetical protein